MSEKAPTKVFPYITRRQAGLFLAILAVGAAFLWWAVRRADLEMRKELLTQTRLVAQAVNLDQIKALTGTEDDLALPAYQEIKAQLVRVKQANSKCRFVYLLGRSSDGKLHFLVDSEPVGSKDYSPPGQIYDEATEELRRVFDDRVAFVEGPTPDRWGIWVSGLVPLTDPHTGDSVAVLGMDINASTWNWEVAVRAALPVGLILALFIVMVAVLAASRRADASPKLVLRRLLPPLAFLLILLMVFSGWLLGKQQRQRLDEAITRKIFEVSVELRLIINQQASGLAEVLGVIAADPGAQQALRQGNADSLRAGWQPAFESLKRKNRVTQFSFFDKERHCLVSLGEPDRSGDRIKRFTTLEAERTGKSASGLELGPDGVLSLRVVQPVFARSLPVGYVELGKGIEEVLSELHTRSGLELAVTIRKERLDRKNWEDGRRRRGLEANWDRLSESVVSYASQGRLPEAFALAEYHNQGRDLALGKTDQEITFEGKIWRVSAFPLQDASGQVAGDLLVILDVTAQTAAYARFIELIGVSGGVILVFLLSFVFVLLHRTDQGIRAQREALQKSEEKYRLVFENAPLGIMHYDQDGTITDLNEAFAAIIGSQKERILGFNMLQQLRDANMHKALEASLAGQAGYFEGEYLSLTGNRATQVRAFFRGVFSKKGAFQGGVSIFEDYSERFRAEQKQQDYLNFLQILLDAIPNPVFYKDTNGVYLGCNKACEEAWGRSKADLVGKSVFEVHSRELAEVHDAKDRILFDHPGLLVYEITRNLADGGSKNFVIHKAAFHKGDGALGGLIGIEIDITERKQAEEALKLNEQRLGALLKLNQMTDASLHDITHFALEEAVRLTGSKIGYIAFLNSDETVLTMHAWSKTAMADCNIEDKPLVYPVENTGLWGEAVRQREPIITNDYAAANPLKRGYPEGHIQIIRHMNVPIIDDNNVVIVAGVGNKPSDYDQSDVRQLTLLMEGMWRIVRRKQTADELEHSLSLLKATLESTADGLLVNDRSGKIVVYNQKFAQMWRISETVLASRDDNQVLVHALDQVKDPEGFLCRVQELFGHPEVESYDLLECKDGRVFERYSQPQRIGQTILGRVWSFRDITEKRQMEHQLLQAQKMEAVGRLAGGVAHDFNNLLSAILGYSEILMLDLKTVDPFYSYIQEIMQAGKRGEALTRQLLAFSRKQILQPQVIDLNTVIADMKKMLERLIGEDINLVTILADGLGAVKVDPGQIEQVIMNLALNARDAMPLGGRLTIETGNVFFDEHYTSRHLELSPGPAVMLAVSDNGEGMDAATQAHMFEPFFTTKDQGKGTGLGLATVYGIVKQSGGLINVYSESGKGTSFKIYLPRVEEPLEIAKVKEVPAEQLAGYENVLVVEDDQALRALIRRALEKYGYRVLEACDGSRACLLVEQHLGEIQLMITDVVMPGMSGNKLADRLKPLQPDMKVLYMSGYTENAIVHHGILDREINFLQKPFKIIHLLQSVRGVLDASPSPHLPGGAPAYAS